MGRVFLSYARQDSVIAERLAEEMANAGHEVWWDRNIQGGSRYADEIDRALKQADAVVVLWSRAACESAWVQDEAVEGRDSGRLVPVTLDSTKPPLGFRQFQAIDLLDWSEGRGPSPKIGELLSAIARVSPETAPAPAERTQPESKPRARSICVLPFVNMSGEAEQEYFSDGISEDITTDLSKVSALLVTARNTAFTFKGSAVDVPAIARQLGVSHVLEGSVRKSGNRVRITAQLIDGASGDHVWAERYDRDLTDIFAIQDEISEAIVAALKLKLLPEEKKAIEQRGTDNADAYNLYLMARQYWLTGNHGDPRREERVVRICSRALEIDPTYGQAWSLLALAEATLLFGYGRPGDGGLASAAKALELDPNIAEAHCVLARHHSAAGRRDEANTELSTALRLNPESWEVNKEAARQCMLERRVPEATKLYEKAVELAENDYHAWAMLVTCYEALGDKEKLNHAARMMVSGAENALAEDPSNGSALGIGAGGLAVLGEKERARDWIDRAILIDPDNYNMRYNFACVLATHLQDREAALEMLTLPLARAGGIMIRHLDTDPDLDPLRDDPRFQAMAADAKKRLGMTETS